MASNVAPNSSLLLSGLQAVGCDILHGAMWGSALCYTTQGRGIHSILAVLSVALPYIMWTLLLWWNAGVVWLQNLYASTTVCSQRTVQPA